jgi:hypothetical protein
MTPADTIVYIAMQIHQGQQLKRILQHTTSNQKVLLINLNPDA